MEKTYIHFTNGTLLDTENPVAYTGNFLLITTKEIKEKGDEVILTTVTKPYDLGGIKSIIMNHKTKKYN